MNNWSQIVRSPHLGLTPRGIEYVLAVVSSPPSRNVSNASGRNLIVDFASKKMGVTAAVESATVEAAYAQILESASICIGYWAQPANLPIILPDKNKKLTPRRLTFDFLAIYANRVEIVECKKEEEAVELSLTQPERYTRDTEGKWCGPLVQESLDALGLKFRIVTSDDLPPTLLRNINFLAEVQTPEYSVRTALTNIRACIENPEEGEILGSLLEKVGRGFTKEDVYLALKKYDLHMLMDRELLVDLRVTRVFSAEAYARAYRIKSHAYAFNTAESILLQPGSRVRWNQANYTICSISDNHVYLSTDNAHTFSIGKNEVGLLIQAGTMVVLGESISLNSVQTEALQFLMRVPTPAAEQKALQRNSFLELRQRNPKAKPEDFGLGAVSNRTIQRWEIRRQESMRRYGTALPGLFDMPRPGRQRDDLLPEMRAAMTEVANEIYFQKQGRSLTYAWRELQRRRESLQLSCPSLGAFRRHISRMRNQEQSTRSRKGKGAAYKYTRSDKPRTNWITASDYPFKFAQIDGKTLDLQVVDDETREPLGKPTLTLIALPGLGSAPVGMALLFEPESYRSATIAIRDMIERFGEGPTFLLGDNGKAFNNTTFDRLLATLQISKMTRLPRDPRFASEIESLFNTLDREVIHNLTGNTAPTQNAREMSSEMDPEENAVWTFRELHERLEHYLFTMLWDAPSSRLGTTPRKALEQAQKTSPDRKARFVLPPEHAAIAYLPEDRRRTRRVQPGRGIYVRGYYYWHESMAKPKVEKTNVVIRYDPFDLYNVYAAIEDSWVRCVALHAPELRNLTEKTRRAMTISHRRLRESHPDRRAKSHGRQLAEFGEQLRGDESTLLEARRARAQQRNSKGSPPKPESPSPKEPTVSFEHLKESA